MSIFVEITPIFLIILREYSVSSDLLRAKSTPDRCIWAARRRRSVFSPETRWCLCAALLRPPRAELLRRAGPPIGPRSGSNCHSPSRATSAPSASAAPKLPPPPARHFSAAPSVARALPVGCGGRRDLYVCLAARGRLFTFSAICSGGCLLSSPPAGDRGEVTVAHAAVGHAG